MSVSIFLYSSSSYRCALATSLAGYKHLMVYGEVMVAISFVMYYYGVNLSEAYWITIDSFVNLGMAWAIMQVSCLTLIKMIKILLSHDNNIINFL